MNWTSNSGEWQ